MERKGMRGEERHTLRNAAKEYASYMWKCEGEHLGLYFHIYGRANVNALHLHIVDLRYTDTTFVALKYKNLPLDDVLQVLRKEIAVKLALRDSVAAPCDAAAFARARAKLRELGGATALLDELQNGGWVDENKNLTTELTPFNIFARIAAEKGVRDKNEQEFLGDYEKEFIVAFNRKENDKNWEKSNGENLGKASMSEHHRFLILNNLSWQTFNVLAFGMAGGEAVDEAIALLKRMKKAAIMYAKQAWKCENKDNLGLYFHIYGHTNINALHLHMVDLRVVGPTFAYLAYKNLPLDDVLGVLEDEKFSYESSKMARDEIAEDLEKIKRRICDGESCRWEKYVPPAVPPAYRDVLDVRVMQWNILADGLANDGFEVEQFRSTNDTPTDLADVIDWDRRWRRALEHVAALAPDVIVFEEMDRLESVQQSLKAYGYACALEGFSYERQEGREYPEMYTPTPEEYVTRLEQTHVAFAPKENSNALRLALKDPSGKKKGTADNDGVAVFWNTVTVEARFIEFLCFDDSKREQGAVKVALTRKSDRREFAVIAAHLSSGKAPKDVAARNAEVFGNAAAATDGFRGGLLKWYRESARPPTAPSSAAATPKAVGVRREGECTSHAKSLGRRGVRRHDCSMNGPLT